MLWTLHLFYIYLPPGVLFRKHEILELHLAKFIVVLNFEIYRYKGRGLFLDPPTVCMQNGLWKLCLPENMQTEKFEMEYVCKWSIFCCWSFLFVSFFLSKSWLVSFSAFSSRDEIFKSNRDGSSLAGCYRSFISQVLLHRDSSGFSHIGALIIEPGKSINISLSLSWKSCVIVIFLLFLGLCCINLKLLFLWGQSDTWWCFNWYVQRKWSCKWIRILVWLHCHI